MTDKWLRSFILCAESKSFTQAANNSYISPTAIIQQINLMESELGFSLFYRYHSGIQLTDAGKSFYAAAQQILKLYDDSVNKGKRFEKEESEILRIAFAPHQFPGHWLDACGSFGRNHKPLKIEMKPIHFASQLQAIQMGDADLCFIGEPRKECLHGCHFEPLFIDQLAFVMSPNNPLASKKMLGPEDIHDTHVLCGKYDFLKQSFEKMLTPYCGNITSIDTEYTMSVRMQTYASDECFVIHSRFRDQYTAMLAVVDSSISAGWIGAVYRKEKTAIVEHAIAYFRDVFGDHW